MFVSFVVPVFHEEECLLKELHARLGKVCRNLKINYELIFVNDDGTDTTLTILKNLRKKDSKIKIISFTRNFGHQMAIMAGLRHTGGDCVVVMDSDLQDPPEIIPLMLKKWQEGYQVVYGSRTDRDEPWWKKICYKIFYRLLTKVSYLKDIPLDAGIFSLMDKQVVKEICKLKEDRPYLRGLRAWVGFTQIGIPYKRPPRTAGKSQYSFVKLMALAIDGLISFSPVALRMMLFTGLGISILSITYALFVGLNRAFIFFKIVGPEKLVPGWTTLASGFMLLMGIQFIFLAVLGEYIGRIYLEVKGRPLYIIKEKIGLKNEKIKD
jgi:glycosyltransferase involved in cell wall biosynthesis